MMLPRADLIDLLYLVAAVLFILGLKMLSSQATAIRGNGLSAVGMLCAVVATLIDQQIVRWDWIVAGLLLGAVLGVWAAQTVKMTAMPELVALFNGFGGLASLGVGWAEYVRTPAVGFGPAAAILATVLVGGITFSGSVVAWGKLSETFSTKPVFYPGHQLVKVLCTAAALGAGTVFLLDPPTQSTGLHVAIVLALVLGVLLTLSIGGADMPVVIALLNSYSGIAACTAGFIIANKVLIVAGALVGASGIILTQIMCKAMNRSLPNVLFGGLGAGTTTGPAAQGEAKAMTPHDAYLVLEAARQVLVVPGYGMAVAQAQHAVRELSDMLQNNGTEVRYAIHPVAGRMPGHMNVLLAEANIPYETLVEPQDVNPSMETIDVAIVIGANDVVNPAAKDQPVAPIYGMPIIEVDRARTVFVLKRSMSAGFAGVDNPLFLRDNTRMIFGDAKATLTAIIGEFKS